MLEPKTMARSRTADHWANVSDEKLIDLELEIDNPESLAGLVREVPPNFADAHVEFKYDLTGVEMTEEFSCVHGHHRHKKGFVMNVDGTRFMVGWLCAKTIYNEDFDRYTADFDAAVIRREAILRVQVIKNAVMPFAAWVADLSKADCVKYFSKLRGSLNHKMEWVYDNLPALAALDEHVTKAKMPKHLCDEVTDVREECNKLMVETSAVVASLAGEAQKVAATIGAIRARSDGLIKRAEALLVKLGDVELFFQPACLAVICEHANKYDNPKRRRYQASMLSLACRGADKASVELPRDFKMPSRQPIESLRTAIANSA
ncbi:MULTISPECIES: hypothetical protein [unclassified Bradyrhizobium]|uniref:hypothetical protein n=1 Tax=unclassified Bradyrhizobium TaxID=2631580 RepID=UPI001BAAC261|nr:MULTISPECIES: hypothetical protein [unclassified Bradyrhizobium]MBR1206604.1 hypothetical protein [Bradyrhizobium sp. AUGA SZCCT0124]MBR1315418.1 hypothetical protein [Bradyrhizobium sp. AUGA SZCCT0051]MBR1338520.1 hypothetical protein [Bradyrhizobium sp. AUGA SZCCT0105]MBR1356175.1 hypothetical protein [Bradyrhizobium sp. AUGA SZCCT0045]